MVHIHIQLLQEDCWRAHIKGLNHTCGNTSINSFCFFNNFEGKSSLFDLMASNIIV